MGSRPCLGVVLNRINRKGSMFQALYSIVVEVQMCNLAVRRKRIGIHGEAMILGSDFDSASRQIFDRLIPAVMTKGQFVCAAAHRQAQKLMTKANPEDWLFAH